MYPRLSVLALLLAALANAPCPCDRTMQFGASFATVPLAPPVATVEHAPWHRANSVDSITVRRLLATVQRAAREASPSLVVARANVEAQRVRASAAGFAPPAYLTAGLSEAPGGSIAQGNLRLEAGREFFASARHRAERVVAAGELLAAETALAIVERNVEAAILRAAVHANGWRDIATRLQAEELLLASADESVGRRFAVGDARYIDVLRLRTERLRLQSERASAIAESRGARGALIGLIAPQAQSLAIMATVDSLVGGVVERADSPTRVGGVITAVERWQPFIARLLSTDSLVALAGDVRAAKVAAAQARAVQALETARRRPQVDAFAGIQRIGQANNGPTLGPSAGITLSLPFTAAGARRAAAAAEVSAVTAADISHTASLDAAKTRVTIAAARFEAARDRLAVFDATLLRGVREESESALAAFRGGSLSLLDFVDFERALSRAEVDRVRALMDAADAFTDLLTGDTDAEALLTFSAPQRR